MFITSFEEQNITYRSCSNFRIHLWTLEVVSQSGTSTVWDETFPSDQEALSVALDGIKAAGGIQAFSELSDLEAKKNIFPESLTRH